MHALTRNTTALFVALMSAACLSVIAQAEETFAVYPQSVRLDNQRDLQRLIVVMTRDDGVTIDVTEQVTVTFEPPELAEWNSELRLRPVSDGEGEIVIHHEGGEIRTPIIVRNVASNPPISLRNDVEPVLMRAGCNSGTCHGSFQGKNGFRLSLFGFDPIMDLTHLTRQAQGRRANVANPEESLMLLKPTASVEHEGGRRFEKDSPLYETLLRWITEGSQDDAPDLPLLTGIEILPPNAVLEGSGATQRFMVLARYADGTDRDVTDLAVLASEDDKKVALEGDGTATAGQPGEAYVMARFGTFAVISQVINVSTESRLEWPADAVAANYVDEFVYAKLRKLRIPPAELCSDEVFVRRVYLDILGVLPTVDEARAFLADTTPDRRAVLITKLLERPEFSELWTMKWAEALRVRSSVTLDRKGMHRYNDWLRQAITSNMPIDELVRQLLTAEGGNFTQPASNYYLVESVPTLVAENVAQVFMGIQIKCAQCHNHPFERWTMNDYYSFAAFFAQVGRKASSDPRERIVFNRGSGNVKHINSGRVMPPKFLGGDVPDVKGKDRRAVLADWLTAPENPWFSKNIANRVWAHFFGRGIIDPPDDVRVSNPPANAELLDELGRRLVEYGYDMRRFITDICNSNTYQLSTRPRDETIRDTRNFVFAQVRRLPSEMLLDAICNVTETKVKFASLPAGARAVQVADGDSGNYFLSVFGRPSRVTVCTCERQNAPTLAQTLHLINGDTISGAISAKDGRLSRRIAEEAPLESVVEELYMAAYSRPPSDEELERFATYVNEAEDEREALEDMYWSILNSKEFVFNH